MPGDDLQPGGVGETDKELVIVEVIVIGNPAIVMVIVIVRN
jgi:hypothetical protein